MVNGSVDEEDRVTAGKDRMAAQQPDPQSFDPVVQTHDSGLGTTYERWALNRFLDGLRQHCGWQTVLEGPGDGITGIAYLNSLGLARAGMQVTIAATEASRAEFARQVWSVYAPSERQPRITVQHPPGSLDNAAGQYDLVWNFNVINRHPQPGVLLDEMIRASRRWVLVIVPNRGNYAFWLHRLHHRASRQAWDHGPVELLAAAPYQRMFAQAGLAVRKVAWVDCPWWPDIVDFSALVADFVPVLKGAATRLKPEKRLHWPANHLPYYEPERFVEVHRLMQRLAFIENSPIGPLKQRFAHHVAVLAEKT